MVQERNRVRGHNYITGLGDGNVHNNNNKNKDRSGGILAVLRDHRPFRGSNGVQEEAIVNAGSDGSNNKHNDGRPYLRKHPKPNKMITNSTSIQLDNNNILYRDDGKGHMILMDGSDKKYYQNQELTNNNNVYVTGSNYNSVGHQYQTYHHPYRHPVPQAADIWHFSVFFVIVATIILIIAIFLNFMNEQFTSPTTSTSSSESIKKNGTTIMNLGVCENAGNSIPPKKYIDSSTKSRKPKTDEWNDDYDENKDLSYMHDQSSLSDNIILRDGLGSGLDDAIVDNSLANNLCYPYVIPGDTMASQHQQQVHRQRKSTVTVPVSSTRQFQTATTANSSDSANSATQRDVINSVSDSDSVTAFSSLSSHHKNPTGMGPGGIHNRGLYYLNQSGNAVIGGGKIGSNKKKKRDRTTPPPNPSPNNNHSTFSFQADRSSSSTAYVAPKLPLLAVPASMQSSTRPTNKSQNTSNSSHAKQHNYRTLHARPLSSTTSSFQSLMEHPELDIQNSFSMDNNTSPTNGNIIDVSSNSLDIGEQAWHSSGLGIAYHDSNNNNNDDYDVENCTVSSYHDNDNINNEILLSPRSNNHTVRYRRREDTTATTLTDSRSESASRLLGPGSDDINYLLGIDNIETNYQIENSNNNNCAKTNPSNRGGLHHNDTENAKLTVPQPYTPGNTKQIQSLQGSRRIPDLFESTPRVTNGRQIIIKGKLGDRHREGDNDRHDRSGEYEGIASNLRYHRQKDEAILARTDQLRLNVPSVKAPNDDSSVGSRFESAGSRDYTSQTEHYNFEFASIPQPNEVVSDSAVDDRQQQDQCKLRQAQSNSAAIPYVPKLVYNPGNASSKLPPESVNVDDLHLYITDQLMETGNVSHWEARVAEESLILKNQHNVDQNNNTLDSVSTFSFDQLSFHDLETTSSRRNNTHDDNYYNDGDIAKKVMNAATDMILSNDTIPSNDPARKSITHVRKDLTTDTDAATSLQGDIEFSDLKLIEVIGGGGFGQVWRAVWIGTPVAVKVLTGSAQSKAVPRAVLQEFAAEINLLKGMRHPNICLYMGACIAPPNRAIITELAANGSLWDALRLPLSPPYLPCDGLTLGGWPSSLYEADQRHGAPPLLGTHGRQSHSMPIPPQGTWHWVLVKHVARGAACGMAYLHKGKPPVLHRDLKSANILLDESYTAKICDFGLSRLKAKESSMTGNCGTVQWMAPEVLSNESYNEKADVYSYGIICWELLTAECPYDGMTPIQCALAVLNRDYRPEIPAWCPPALRALIRSCVKKDPELRPTFEQIIAALVSMP